MYYTCITHLLGDINMRQEIGTKREKYYSTSIRLPKALYEQLELKSQEMGDIGVSETIRILLSSSLENPHLNFLNPKKAEIELNNKIQYKILQNVIACYYLLKEQMVHTEEGLERDHTAHERGKKAVEKILG